MTAHMCTENFNGQTIEMTVGESLEIRLQENPTTGFRWQLIADDGAVCALISDAFEGPGGPLGRGGEHGWLFKALEPGECDIEFHYRRRWMSAAKPVRTFRIHIRIESNGRRNAPRP